MSFGQHEYPDHLWDPAYMEVEMRPLRIEIYEARRLKVGRKLWNWRMISGGDIVASSNQGYANRATLISTVGATVLGATWVAGEVELPYQGHLIGEYVRPPESLSTPEAESERIAAYIVYRP